MKRYFIQEHRGKVVWHGGIGNVDAETVLLSKGFLPLEFPAKYDFGFIGKIRRLLYLLRTVCSIPAGAIILFQHPVYARMSNLLIRLLHFRSSIRIICFIADIDSIRNGDSIKLKRERNFLSRLNFFIAHNEKMSCWLTELNSNARITKIDFFDYLATPRENAVSKSCEIAFAGNLEKSPFLAHAEELIASSPNLKFMLYGKLVPENIIRLKNIDYCGFSTPHELPGKLRGAFGLVWDGTSVDQLDGSYGRYQQLNSPNKLSLYILAGIPLIVAESAAAASLINHFNIGFTIESLHEIEHKIESLPETAYQQMKDNLVLLAARISNGACLSAAIDELVLQLIDK